MECIICSEDITAATGRTVLGCGHEFHAVCVARWFCRQEGASSCPCCRQEAGRHADIATAAAADSDSDSEWSDDEDEDDDDASFVSVEFYWRRNEVGVWQRIFRETATTKDWDPAVEPEAVPDEITEGAVAFQALWRGHRARLQCAVTALLSLKQVAGAAY